MGQLYDDGCEVKLTKQKLSVIKNNIVVMEGHRNYTDGLWDTPITKSSITSYKKLPQANHAGLYNKILKTTHQVGSNFKIRQTKKTSSYRPTVTLPGIQDCEAIIQEQFFRDNELLHSVYLQPNMNVVIRKDRTKQDLVKFLHAAAYGPTNKTWTKAVNNNNYTTWLGLTSNLINKHLPPSISTSRGHMKQEFEGIQSTKQIKNNDNFFPSSDVPNEKTNQVIFAMYNEGSKVYSDLCGRFPYQSSRDNNYIIVAYHYDANAILLHAVKNQNAASLVEGWKILLKKFTTAGVKPETWILDNE